MKRVYLESRRRFEYFGEKNWCTYTYDILCKYDMGYVWEENLFRKEFKGEMKGVLGERIETEWRKEALGKKTLMKYASMDVQLCFQDYLKSDHDHLEGRQCAVARSILCRFRAGDSGLRYQSGAWEMRPDEEGIRSLDYDRRRCLLCYGDVETMMHFVLDCPMYDMFRRRLIDGVRHEKCMKGVIDGFVVLERQNFVDSMLYGGCKMQMMTFLFNAMKKRDSILG